MYVYIQCRQIKFPVQRNANNYCCYVCTQLSKSARTGTVNDVYVYMYLYICRKRGFVSYTCIDSIIIKVIVLLIFCLRY